MKFDFVHGTNSEIELTDADLQVVYGGQGVDIGSSSADRNALNDQQNGLLNIILAGLNALNPSSGIGDLRSGVIGKNSNKSSSSEEDEN